MFGFKSVSLGKLAELASVGGDELFHSQTIDLQTTNLISNNLLALSKQVSKVNSFQELENLFSQKGGEVNNEINDFVQKIEVSLKGFIEIEDNLKSIQETNDNELKKFLEVVSSQFKEIEESIRNLIGPIENTALRKKEIFLKQKGLKNNRFMYLYKNIFSVLQVVKKIHKLLVKVSVELENVISKVENTNEDYFRKLQGLGDDEYGGRQIWSDLVKQKEKDIKEHINRLRSLVKGKDETFNFFLEGGENSNFSKSIKEIKESLKELSNYINNPEDDKKYGKVAVLIEQKLTSFEKKIFEGLDYSNKIYLYSEIVKYENAIVIKEEVKEITFIRELMAEIDKKVELLKSERKYQREQDSFITMIKSFDELFKRNEEILQMEQSKVEEIRSQVKKSLRNEKIAHYKSLGKMGGFFVLYAGATAVGGALGGGAVLTGRAALLSPKLFDLMRKKHYLKDEETKLQDIATKYPKVLNYFVDTMDSKLYKWLTSEKQFYMKNKNYNDLMKQLSEKKDKCSKLEVQEEMKRLNITEKQLQIIMNEIMVCVMGMSTGFLLFRAFTIGD